MTLRLRFCPMCRRHFPTRMAFITCSTCRASQRQRLKRKGLA